jgi:phosphoenolpyruvate-protein kinase (PTS system EI component)
MGGQAAYLPRLLDLGITTVSVSPRLIGLARMSAKKHWQR